MSVNTDKPVIVWLLTGCALIYLMVVVGGITRLTGSGLSIVEWDLIMGTLPPLSAADWHILFLKYQQSPQYLIENYHFSLEEFKSIFWWEYIHRLLGRFIGMVFIIPFLYFLVTKKVSGSLIPKLLIILALGGLQGALGWYMVKSGLVKDPSVSHYRLAAHLITAFITFSFTFKVALDLINKNNPAILVSPGFRKSLMILFPLVILQIIYGAFVAGLKAGHSYTTFPKMGDEWIAESVTFAYNKMGIVSLFENPASVQFVHRLLAFAVLSLAIFIWRKASVSKVELHLRLAANILLAVIMGQFLLGVLTLIYSVPPVLGVLHQAGALAVLGCCVYLHALSASPVRTLQIS
jgi:heme a synthase